MAAPVEPVLVAIGPGVHDAEISGGVGRREDEKDEAKPDSWRGLWLENVGKMPWCFVVSYCLAEGWWEPACECECECVLEGRELCVSLVCSSTVYQPRSMSVSAFACAD